MLRGAHAYIIFSIALALVFICYFSCKKEFTRNGEKKTLKTTKNLITIGISQEPDSLFVPFKEMMASEEVVRVGNYTLTIFDEKWNLVPWVAKEIPTEKNGKLVLYVENGQPKMKATWVIRDEFFWADGKPLTADDFVFAHRVFSDPTQEIIDRTAILKIEKMEAAGADRKTLIVTWKEPYAYYHNYRNHEALPRHIVEPIYTVDPGSLKNHPFGSRPLLAGPFTIKEWVAGSHIVAERNSFAAGFLKPHLDQVVWKIIPQTNTLESNIVSGSIDAVSPIGLSLEQAIEIEKRHGDILNVYFTQGLVWEHIDFNLDNEILKDKRVRLALAHGCNREGIASGLFGGKQPVAHGTQPPKSPYYNDNIKKYSYNAEEAEKLLDQAGWLQSEPGAVRMKNGKSLKLVLMTTSGDRTREKVEQLLAADWKKIGVDIQIENQPSKVFFGETLRRRKFEHMALFAWIMDPIEISEGMWRCDTIPSEKNNYVGQNQSGWCNKEADILLKQASAELDENKRIVMGKTFEEIWTEDLPSLPLFFRVEVSVTRKNLIGWKPTGMLQPVTWNAQEWAWN